MVLNLNLLHVYCCQIELLCFDICHMDERRERLSFFGSGDDVTRMVG